VNTQVYSSTGYSTYTGRVQRRVILWNYKSYRFS